MKDKIICLQRAGGSRVFETEAERMKADGITPKIKPTKNKSKFPAAAAIPADLTQTKDKI